MPKLKSTVSAAKVKTKKAKSAARPKAKVTAKRAARPKAKVTTKSAVAEVPKRARTAEAVGPEGVRSAADPLTEVSTVGAERPSALPGAVSAAIPFGEALDVEQQRLRNAPEGANIYDVSIGYGVALPGESGVAAVERIKSERAAAVKSRVKRTRK